MEEWRNVSVLKKTACNLLAFHSSCTIVFQHKLGIQWGCMLKSCDQPQLITVTEMSKQISRILGVLFDFAGQAHNVSWLRRGQKQNVCNNEDAH